MKTITFKIVFTLLLINQFLFSQNANGQTWTALGSGIGTGLYDTTSSVNTLASDNVNLYAAGYFSYAGDSSISNIAEWDGTTWSPMGTGIVGDSDFGYVEQLATYNGTVYAGGYFNTAGGITAYNIAQWSEGTWAPLGTGIGLGANDTVSDVAALAVSNGSLYVGGFFDTAGSAPANNIAQWNGSIWSALGSGVGTGINDSTSAVYSITGDDSAIYVGGFFSVAGNTTAYNVAQWNASDSVWSTLGNGIGSGAGDLSSAVYATAFYNGNLYVAGFFQLAGGSAAYNIAEWNGIGWLPLGNGIGGGEGDDSSTVTTLTVYNGNLYVGGYFTLAGGNAAYNIAEWNDSTWLPLGSGIGAGITDSSSEVYALAVYNGNLYAGGYFDEAGGNEAFNIGEWQAPAGIREVAENKDVSVYPNPNDGRVNISLQNVDATSQLQIYNLLGAKVYQSQITSGTTGIDLSSDAAGAYFYRLCTTEGNLISAGKFVIQ